MNGNRGRWQRLLFGIALALVIYVIIVLPSLYGDYLWFEGVGYESVFLTILGYRIGLFAGSAVLSFVVLYGSYLLALRNIRAVTPATPPWTYLVGIVVLVVLIGFRYAVAWDIVLRFMHATPFGVTDPVYGNDVAFYVYTLPFVNLVIGFVMLLAVTGLLVSLAVYARPFAVLERETPTGETSLEFDIVRFFSNVREHAYPHVVSYIGVLFLALAAKFYIDRFELLFSTRGTVFGIGATDATIYQPLLVLLAVACVIGGVVILAGGWIKDDRAVYIPIAIVVGFLLLGQGAGGAYQSFVVEPDEFNKEEEFIANEIEFTNKGYALERISEREFEVSETITREEVEQNPGTIGNARLWDPRPLLTTYNELQIFRTYYTFTDVDVDRYEIEGEKKQVMISAREVDFSGLSPESQTWVNRHLVYTHGFGVVMSPVKDVTGEGLPKLYIQDIPPNSSVDVPVTEPRIYYGEETVDYAIVNSKTRELDYPSGEENVYTNYDEDGGVVLDSVIKELVYSIKFGAPQIILSDSVTRESRLQFNRDIHSRTRAIAPFLEYDRDPYVVVADGKVYWIYDAYTTTDGYPYSKRIRFKGKRTNYVRNSVKVVIDAHTGETTYYVAEPDDPVIQTYRKAFPDLFEDMAAMPPSLHDHVRYPEDAFSVQAGLYLNYHMREPQVFYNKEDAWRIPDEVARGEQIPMEPYYIIMSFPGSDESEFVMIQPYIPRGRENMIGWLAARSDRPNYGDLQAFLFSKQRLIFGPMQIESRIDQDAEISQQITLWSQSGSAVIRGNLLAIPIADTVIYIEPLFLESKEQGALPELKRVILAQGDRVTMQPTLDEALAVRFGAARAEEPRPPGGGVSQAELERARELYGEAQAALEQGDFVTYAEKITELGQYLEELRDRGNQTA